MAERSGNEGEEEQHRPPSPPPRLLLLPPKQIRLKKDSRRISRSMDSLEDILETLEELTSEAPWRMRRRKSVTTTLPNKMEEGEAETAKKRSLGRSSSEGGGERPVIVARTRIPSHSPQPQEAKFRFYRSPLDPARPVVAALPRRQSGGDGVGGGDGGSGGGGGGSRVEEDDNVRRGRSQQTFNSPSPAPAPPPPAPRSEDRFVEMLNDDWDAYESSTSGRIFYHNPTSGETSWKPPRGYRRSLSSEKSVESPSWMDPNRRRKPKRASLPRTSNAVFTFGGSRDAEEEDVEEKEKGAKEKGKAEVDEDRVSIVRDSIRRSDQSDVQVPPGYTELYSKSTGLISYHDNVQDLLWFTALDQKGRLYFYTEGGRAEWKLPELPSKLATNQKKRRSKEEKEARGHRAALPLSSSSPPPNQDDETFSVVRSGNLAKKGGGGGNKWVEVFCALSQGYLLFFNNENDFRRMQLRRKRREEDDTGKEEGGAPESRIDLSQCLVRWDAKAGKNNKRSRTLEVRSLLRAGSPDLQLRFSDSSEASEWFNSLAEAAREARAASKEITPTAGGRTTRPESPSLSLSSAPPTPLSPKSPSKKDPADRASLTISKPVNVVKASPEELKEKLKLALRNSDVSDPGLSVLIDGIGDGGATATPPLPLSPPPPPPTLSPPHSPRGNKFVKNARRVQRAGALTQSFRRMAETVHLRPKDGPSRLERAPSRRSKLLSRFFDQQGDEKERRKSRQELERRGILRREEVFGNHLSAVAMDPDTGVPFFLVRCVRRLDQLVDTVGIYRVNGDAAAVQKVRLDVDKDNYKVLESTKDVSLLASTLKLFFRELPEPLISKETRDRLYGCAYEKGAALVSSIKSALEETMTEPKSLEVLRYLLLHLRRVADEPANKMDSENLSIVFSPNLVHSVTQARRPESLISEMELNNVIVSHLIQNVHKVFE